MFAYLTDRDCVDLVVTRDRRRDPVRVIDENRMSASFAMSMAIRFREGVVLNRDVS